MTTHEWERKKITILKSSRTVDSATKSGDHVLDKPVREYTCMRSTRWPSKLFLNLIDDVCVNAFVLWML
jgi:hypothetical protein